MTAEVGINLQLIFKISLMLGIIVMLIFVIAWTLKLFEKMKQTHGIHHKTHKTLELQQSLFIDSKRRLVVIRWHDKQHLILLGEPNVLIESQSFYDTKSQKDDNHER